MMWGYDFSWGWLMMSFGMILWIALLVVLVWATIHWLDRRTPKTMSSATGTPAESPSALELLRRRYAQGEIDTVTFEQMRERLQASDPRSSQYERQSVTSVR